MGTDRNWIKAGEFLRELRKHKRLSILKVAREIGVSGNYISLIERGKRQPSLQVIDALALFYDIDTNELSSMYSVDHSEPFLYDDHLRKVLTQLSTDKRLTEDDVMRISEKLHEIIKEEKK